MTSLRCPSCQSDNLSDSRFCDACGLPLSVQENFGPWRIGSDPTCELFIDANTISALHARLSLESGRWWLEDLGSTNGTFVNGQRVQGRKQIHRDCLITLGRQIPMPWPRLPVPVPPPPMGITLSPEMVSYAPMPYLPGATADSKNLGAGSLTLRKPEVIPIPRSFEPPPKVNHSGSPLRLVGNILWVLFGGLFVFLHYMVAGFLMCLTLIGIPFGIQAFKVGFMALWPFGKKVVRREGASGCLSALGNFLWFFAGGAHIAFHHFLWALFFLITILGIPFAIQHFKLMALALAPFGKEMLPADAT